MEECKVVKGFWHFDLQQSSGGRHSSSIEDLEELLENCLMMILGILNIFAKENFSRMELILGKYTAMLSLEAFLHPLQV